MSYSPFDSDERCCVCGHQLGGPGPQKGLCDACMHKFQDSQLAPEGQRCPLCGERRRRNLVRHVRSGEFICYSCHQAVDHLPKWKQQDLKALTGAFGRRLGSD